MDAVSILWFFAMCFVAIFLVIIGAFKANVSKDGKRHNYLNIALTMSNPRAWLNLPNRQSYSIVAKEMLVLSDHNRTLIRFQNASTWNHHGSAAPCSPHMVCNGVEIIDYTDHDAVDTKGPGLLNSSGFVKDCSFTVVVSATEQSESLYVMSRERAERYQ